MNKYIGIVILSVLMACTNAPKKTETTADSTAKTEPAVAAGTIQLADPKIESIYTDYIGLKNSLVAGNAAGSSQTALDLSKALSAYAGCENTALIADKIAGSGDLKIQRKEFTALSSDIIALLKHAELKKGTIYVQHCPMANNGDGGDWLSSEKKIRNPYYGDEMLECGGVVEEIKSKI